MKVGPPVLRALESGPEQHHCMFCVHRLEFGHRYLWYCLFSSLCHVSLQVLPARCLFIAHVHLSKPHSLWRVVPNRVFQ